MRGRERERERLSARLFRDLEIENERWVQGCDWLLMLVSFMIAPLKESSTTDQFLRHLRWLTLVLFLILSTDRQLSFHGFFALAGRSVVVDSLIHSPSTSKREHNLVDGVNGWSIPEDPTLRGKSRNWSGDSIFTLESHAFSNLIKAIPQGKMALTWSVLF